MPSAKEKEKTKKKNCLIIYNFRLFNLFRFRAAAAAIAAQTATVKNSRKIPPPLLRSRTLPAIIVPGISILHTQLNPSRLAVGK